MLSYAVGAIVAADLRARVKALHGPFSEGDPGWYAWMSSRLYRFGLERPSRRVLEDFLGRPVSPRAFLDDLARGQTSSAEGGNVQTAIPHSVSRSGGRGCCA
jgi:Zn-dependent M32 family carboxypeptidase